ncbi:MAG: hypothetical protein EZS28_048037, partial [Streblomastix strix]
MSAFSGERRRNVQQTFDELKNRRGDKLIIDLRGNRIGCSALAMRTLQHISNNTIYPLFGYFDIRHSLMNDQIYDNGDLKFGDLYEPLKKTPQYPLDQQHIIFVTDGLCAEACGIFLKRVHETHVGKIVALGLDPYKAKNDYCYELFVRQSSYVVF